MIKCNCKPEDKHGTTQVHCCNECGLPTEDFWIGGTGGWILSSNRLPDPEVGKLVGLRNNEVTVLHNTQWELMINEVKPIFRRLSSMTEEESKEAHAIYYKDKIQLLAIMDVAHFELCRYLMSKGFWLYGDDWFTEGLIIDADTVK